MTILEHCHRAECTQVVDALQRRIAELDAALDVALEAFETYFNQYPHMQKGYTLDAIEILKEARRD